MHWITNSLIIELITDLRLVEIVIPVDIVS